MMRGLWRPLAMVSLALLVPVLPFLSFGAGLEQRIEGWFEPPPAPAVIVLLTVAVLSSDILLPVPSSLVSTIAGAQLGIVAATAASWLGMTLGAMLGFFLAKSWGRAVAVRLSSAEDLARMDQLARQVGPAILIVTRALPVLAEASVLLLGTTQLAWRRFLPAVMLSNLGIAAVYAVLGQLAKTQGELPLALAASIALPIAATTLARRFLRQRTVS